MSLHGYPCLNINVDIHACVDNWRPTSKNHGYPCWYPGIFGNPCMALLWILGPGTLSSSNVTRTGSRRFLGVLTFKFCSLVSATALIHETLEVALRESIIAKNRVHVDGIQTWGVLFFVVGWHPLDEGRNNHHQKEHHTLSHDDSEWMHAVQKAGFLYAKQTALDELDVLQWCGWPRPRKLAQLLLRRSRVSRWRCSGQLSLRFVTLLIHCWGQRFGTDYTLAKKLNIYPSLSQSTGWKKFWLSKAVDVLPKVLMGFHPIVSFSFTWVSVPWEDVLLWNKIWLGDVQGCWRSENAKWPKGWSPRKFEELPSIRSLV